MKLQKYSILVSIFLVLIYIKLSFFTLRSDFTQLFILYILLFVGYIFHLFSYRNDFEKLYFITGIIFRISLLFSIPNLSDDFYRFVWDGKLINMGINPLQYLPSELIEKFKATGLPIMGKLYDNMNSQQHYTCYPPVNQLFFSISAFFSNKNLYASMVAMKTIIFIADVGSFFLIKKVLKQFKLPVKNIFIYWLNPLVIIELVGNMHFEGVMIFFLLLAIILLLKNKFWFSAFFYAVSISVKLIPLMFLPILYSSLGFKKWLIYCSTVCVLTIVFFLPFFSSGNFTNFLISLDLYFQKFEFNASVYYIVREIGYWVKGYNIIHSSGVVLSIISLIIILVIGFAKRNKFINNMFVAMLYILTTYYLLAMIVHPWYIVMLVFLTIFSKHRYAVVWSFLIILSYYTYLTTAYNENLWFVAIEYMLLFGYIIYEFIRIKKGKLEETLKIIRY